MAAHEAPCTQARAVIASSFLREVNRVRILELLGRSMPVTAQDAAGKHLLSLGLPASELAGFGRVLRYAPSLPYWQRDALGEYVCKDRFPGLLAVFERGDLQAGDSLTETPPLLLRVFLNAAGELAQVAQPCRLSGAVGPIRGLAVKLGAPVAAPGGFRLGLAVGLPNAIKAHMQTGLPVWAVKDEGALSSFHFPRATPLRWLHIFTNEATSQPAADLARKAAACGIRADVRSI
jgi:hypothetical protein